MIEYTLYIFLSLFNLYLGILFILPSKQNKSLKLFLAFLILYPSAGFLNNTFAISQITVFHFFFFPSFIFLIANIVSYKKIPYQYFDFLFIIIFLVLILTVYSLANQEAIRVQDYFKDIKVFLILFLALGFAYFFKNGYSEGFIDEPFIDKIIKYNFFVDTAFFASLFIFDSRYFLSGDPSFLIKEVRYNDMGTYILIFIVLYRISLGKRVTKWQWIFTVLPILYSGNRTIIAAIILVFVLKLLINATRRKIIFLTFMACLLPLLFFFQEKIDIPIFEKFQNISSYDKLSLALNNRFSPFFDEIEEFEHYEHILGKGIGLSFFIPWFSYRPEIDVYNVYIDNLYLTLYAKYGIFFSLTILSIFFFYFSVITDRKFLFYYIFFFFIQGLTTAFLYQHYIIFALVFPLLITSVKDRTKKLSTTG